MCPWCNVAKQFLKENNIPYEEYDVSQNSEKAQEMINKTNQRGVPVIDIDGKLIIGFDKEALKKALGLK